MPVRYLTSNTKSSFMSFSVQSRISCISWWKLRRLLSLSLTNWNSILKHNVVNINLNPSNQAYYLGALVLFLLCRTDFQNGEGRDFFFKNLFLLHWFACILRRRKKQWIANMPVTTSAWNNSQAHQCSRNKFQTVSYRTLQPIGSSPATHQYACNAVTCRPITEQSQDYRRETLAMLTVTSNMNYNCWGWHYLMLTLYCWYYLI